MSMLVARTELPCPVTIPELFYHILDAFDPPTRVTEKAALFALARTCRAFLEPALDRLWRELRSLKPLIRCYTTADNTEHTMPPTSSEFAIIRRYSHRILRVNITDSCSMRFLQCTSMRPDHLLPNLMALRWNPLAFGAPISIIFIQRLLGPALVSLVATLDEGDGATLFSFLDNYPLLCRNLKSVEFDFTGSHSWTSIVALSRSVCKLEILECVVLHADINNAALSHLCTLPTLKAINIRLSQSSFPLPVDPPFANAEELGFVVYDLHLITILLRPRDQIFHTFRLYHHGRRSTEALLTFLNVLASRSPKVPLRKLTLSFGDFNHPLPVDEMRNEAERYRITYKTLEPLMTIGSLRELVIEWGEQISLDDDELVKLVHSWPLLQVFKFYCGRGGYPPFSTKYASLKGLLSLVDACPALYTLSLPLDARRVPEIKDPKPRETVFTCLIVPESPIDQARPVAEFLFTHLPCVTMIDWRFLRPPGTDTAGIMVYERAWQKVETRLAKLRGAEVSSSDGDSVGLEEGSDSDT